MTPLFFYVVIYYNIDKLFQNIYLPIYETSLISLSNEPNLYFLLTTTSWFMMILYLYTLIIRIFINKIYDKYCICLMSIYLKYIIDILATPQMTVIQYETSRTLMWIFSTPLMLKMYCDLNNIPYKNIKIHYHLLSIIPHVFVIPFKSHWIYWTTSAVCSIPLWFFLKNLNTYQTMPFTNTFILIWVIFISIHILEMTQLVSSQQINAFYNISDTVCKFICNIMIFSRIEEQLLINQNIDLQSVNFLTHMIKNIQTFEKDNPRLTPFCNNIVSNTKQTLNGKIPQSNENLKLELLKKILPFDLDKKYIQTINNDGFNREYNFICVLFMDILNYTELAHRYDSKTIFKLLHNIYNHFDNIIKKYQHLQKIETIGDAYMVVGDIYRLELNHKIVIKEIILMALEFITEIKTIPTPDQIPLAIRIGINMGAVNIGILGNEIPRLCIVGNTVNVASRLQSTADENTVQLSRHIFEHIGEINFGVDIRPTKKESVFLKNIGTVTTYVIDGSIYESSKKENVY